MLKITYANDYTVMGNIVDENELFYVVEFEASEGFFDTVSFEKELTTFVEVEEKNKIQKLKDDRYENRYFEGIVIDARIYQYIVCQNELSENTITVYKLKKRDNGNYVATYYWDIKKDTLKGSGGLSKKVMEVVKGL